MPSNRIMKWGGGAILFLILANIVSQIYWNWGLITVKVQDAPLSKVIKSIEWQGWVKIYTNLPPDSKVSMYVDHVPLAEAMETLAANVGGRPMGADRPREGGGGPNSNGAASAPSTPTDGGSNTNAPAGIPPGGPGGFAGGGPGGDRPPGGGGPGGPGGRGGGFGGGGFGGGAQWNLAFFVAPTSAQVKQEIQAFQSGTTDDDTKVYTYQTPLQFIASGDDMPAADPRLQSWPGYKAPDPSATPASDGQAAPPAAPANPTVQTYLQAFAESSNIWIMTPGTWASDVSIAPPANSSIIRAVKNFISKTNGSVTQAIVLRVGRGARGGGGGNRGGGFADMDAMQDRLRNAINGLPEDSRAGALDQLQQEVNFYQQVKTAPPEQQPQMIREHIMAKMASADNSRRSPEKRAGRYARAVSNRVAVKGQ